MKTEAVWSILFDISFNEFSCESSASEIEMISVWLRFIWECFARL